MSKRLVFWEFIAPVLYQGKDKKLYNYFEIKKIRCC
jgi:hypothetical protein